MNLIRNARQAMETVIDGGPRLTPFGLHSAAIAVREMGGALAAHSDGTGTGATFTLELPIKKAEEIQ